MILLIGIGLTVTSLLFYRYFAGLKLAYKKQVKSSMSMVPAQMDTVSEMDLEGLPAALRRYMEFSGVVGSEHVKHFKVVFTGRFKMDRYGDWAPVRAEQYSFVGEGRRLFAMEMRYKGLQVYGIHHYWQEDAYMKIKILDLVQVVHNQGEYMHKGETVTWFNDLCIMAPAALLRAEVCWEEIDANRVRGRLSQNGNTVETVLTIDDEGKLVNFQSEYRYTANVDGTFENIPWSTPMQDFKDITHRDCTDTDYPALLRLMQNNFRTEAYDRLWDIVRLDWVRYHYYTRKTLSHRTWNDSTHLWFFKGKLLGAVIFEEQKFYTVQIEPEYKEMGLDLIPEMASWAEQKVLSESNDQGSINIDIEIDQRDKAYRAAFIALGYKATDDYMIIYNDLDLTRTIPKPRLPAGYVLRNVSSDEDLRKKFVVNTAAFNISGIYEEDTFFTLREAPYYNQDLDLIIEDGEVFSATCTGWYDEKHKAGYIEPLGAHPEYQKQGLGKAIVYSAMQRLKDMGATTLGMVSSESSRMFYQSLGFKEVSRSYGYTKELPGPTK